MAFGDRGRGGPPRGRGAPRGGMAGGRGGRGLYTILSPPPNHGELRIVAF